MKARILSFVIAFIALLSFNNVSAQNAHFVGQPTKNDLGTQLDVCFKLAGLGNNQQIYVVVESTNSVASVDCRNKGGNIAPGQRTTVTTIGEGTFRSGKNGSVEDCVRTDAPSVSGAQACPNGSWTAIVTDVDFSGTTTIRVYSDAAHRDQIASYTF